MTASIKGFVTREDAGLSRPNSISKKITPSKGGVAVHYGGPRQSAADPGSSHSQCLKVWRSWQKYHLSKDWADIAYTGGFCNHGYAFAGRGINVRTAANGTNTGNQNFYGVCWIGGEGQKPTKAAYDALDWWIMELRQNGSAGKQVRPHNFFKSTGCPGDLLEDHAALRHNKTNFGSSGGGSTTPPPSTSGSSLVEKIQRSVEVNVDGKWGPKTDERVLRMRDASRAKSGWPSNISRSFNIKDVQSVIDTKVDGIWGPNSQAALVKWIREFQGVIGTPVDGKWGPKTNDKLLAHRRKYYNRY